VIGRMNSLLRRKDARILITIRTSFRTNLVSYTAEDCPFDEWKLNEGKKEELFPHRRVKNWFGH